MWVESNNGRVDFHFETFAENDNDITLLNPDRGVNAKMYVKLDANYAYWTFDLDEEFKMFHEGMWLYKSKIDRFLLKS